jgi:hypothetical protein
VGQGRGFHGRQGIDAGLNCQGIRHLGAARKHTLFFVSLIGVLSWRRRGADQFSRRSIACRAAAVPLLPDHVCLFDRLPIGLYMTFFWGKDGREFDLRCVLFLHAVLLVRAVLSQIPGCLVVF